MHSISIEFLFANSIHLTSTNNCIPWTLYAMLFISIHRKALDFIECFCQQNKDVENSVNSKWSLEFFVEKTKTWMHSLPWNVIFFDRNSSFAIVNHVFNHGNFGNHVIEIIDPLKKYLSMKTERLVRVFYVLFPDLKHHKGLVIYTFCYIDLRKFNPFFVDVFNWNFLKISQAILRDWINQSFHATKWIFTRKCARPKNKRLCIIKMYCKWCCEKYLCNKGGRIKSVCPAILLLFEYLCLLFDCSDLHIT